MDGRHALTMACTSGHPPSRTTTSTRMHPKNASLADAAYTKNNANGGPALDRPDSEITVSTIKIFSMLD